MALNKILVKSVEELLQILEKFNQDNENINVPIYILFINREEENDVGKEDDAENSAVNKNVIEDEHEGYDVEAVVNEYLSYIPESRELTYISCYLTPDMWGPTSYIRNDRSFRVYKVPTLLRWKGPQRLEMSEITRFPLLSLLFEEDCEENELNKIICDGKCQI